MCIIMAFVIIPRSRNMTCPVNKLVMAAPAKATKNWTPDFTDIYFDM